MRSGSAGGGRGSHRFVGEEGREDVKAGRRGGILPRRRGRLPLPGGAPLRESRTTMTPAPARYREAGVDIPSKYEAVERAKDAIRRSFTSGVIGDIGSFGGLFDPARVGAEGTVLVASADGVGTKVDVARRAGVYDTVGRDLVNHCVNDILVQGARPLFFLDYVAVGRMDPPVVADLIRGCADACRENGLALLGGETAEMPGVYAPGDFDLAGFIVGCVARDRVLDGSRVRPGQVLLGLRSSGLHTNGYSLARKIVFEESGLSLPDRIPELGGPTVGEALLAVHRSYYRVLWPLLERGLIAGMAHITGGGIVDNLPRILGNCDARIDRSSWEPPALFRFLCERGGVGTDESYRVFNMGIGMILVVDPGDLSEVVVQLEGTGETALRIGGLEPAQADAQGAHAKGQVRWTG